jgi:hypothetical protein
MRYSLYLLRQNYVFKRNRVPKFYSKYSSAAFQRFCRSDHCDLAKYVAVNFCRIAIQFAPHLVLEMLGGSEIFSTTIKPAISPKASLPDLH